ncbi:tripartite tricarboxylate transporter TctB family protein [Halomonas denitrificans]|uniref:tripartite tricarboxylate transporter TctB family protein n=1 Tax=Halomonas denitrificans TaxID=370769 RepID=UPI001CD57383|nr:tripartite tricarboxylate transporter TctB family protein [Halomonas denitrificans]MCA0974395.1 tripartite tricarboxylate transporter TctB family protein [Halomonas denitrificans]
MKLLLRAGGWLGGRRGVVACLLAVTLIYLVEAFKIAPPLHNGALTASFFPVLLGVVMLLALAFVVRADRHADGDSAEEEAPMSESDQEATQAATSGEPAPASIWQGALAVTLATGLYISLFASVGYFLSTFAYAFAMMLIFGAGRPALRSLGFKALVAAVIALLGYALFELVFQVRLPTLWR